MNSRITDNQLVTIGDRVRFIREKENLTITKFSQIIKIARETISKVEKNHSKVGLSKEGISEIISQFNINYDWLVNGTGEMSAYKGDSAKAIDVIKNRMTYKTKKEQFIPFYDIDITAGNMPLFQDNETEPVQYYSMPSFSDCTAIFAIYGESMNPRYKPGDRVIVKEYQHFSEYIRYGEVYLIFTKNEERMIKIIRKSDREGFIKLCSTNPDYDDFEISLSLVTRMFLVRGKFSIENE